MISLRMRSSIDGTFGFDTRAFGGPSGRFAAAGIEHGYGYAQAEHAAGLTAGHIVGPLQAAEQVRRGQSCTASGVGFKRCALSQVLKSPQLCTRRRRFRHQGVCSDGGRTEGRGRLQSSSERCPGAATPKAPRAPPRPRLKPT